MTIALTGNRRVLHLVVCLAGPMAAGSTMGQPQMLATSPTRTTVQQTARLTGTPAWWAMQDSKTILDTGYQTLHAWGSDYLHAVQGITLVPTSLLRWKHRPPVQYKDTMVELTNHPQSYFFSSNGSAGLLATAHASYPAKENVACMPLDDK